MKSVKGNIICSCDKGFILQQKEKIYYINEQMNDEKLLFSLDRKVGKRFISKCGRVGERLVRSDIKTGIVFENILYFSDFGTCYEYDFVSKELIPQHKHRLHMRAPLNYCVIERVDGFVDQVCYGEYFGNEHRESVNIWHKPKASSTWEIAATFGSGQIRHIHGIFVDRWRNCVYILTGDTDEESAIWVARDNFRSIKKLISGDQQARSCQMMVYKDGFLYCTDSEYEENTLYNVIINDKDSLDYVREPVKVFDGSIIYGAQTESTFFFSTTVEPDKGSVQSKKVSVYFVNVKDKNVYGVFQAEKDMLPMKLFQYGCARIVASANSIVMSFCGVKKYDGRIIMIRRSKL